MSDEFRTPPKLFKELNDVTPFFWDACCKEDNCLVGPKVAYGFPFYNYLNKSFYDLRNRKDLKDKSIFINPPYSDPLPFIKKAWEDSKYFRVVLLVKTDMTTKWFNYALDSEPDIYTIHMNQRTGETITEVLTRLQNRTQKVDYKNVGIVHLRKRLKFYVSEEVFINDYDLNKSAIYDRFGPGVSPILETKHYNRVEDGIVSKASANFPSMIMIFDRRRP